MSVARPARSLLGRCVTSTRTPASFPLSARSFHTSALCQQRRSRFRNVKAQELGLLKPENMGKLQKDKFPDYTPEELAELKQKYSPEYIESIQAGEKAVDTEDMIIQGRMRDDAYRPTYVDDYTVLDPRYDIKPDIPGTPQEIHWPSRGDWIDEYGMRLSKMVEKKTDDQLTRAMIRALRKVKQSKGEEMIDLTVEELDEMEKNPELVKKYMVEDDDVPEPDANASGPEYLTRAQAMQLDEAVVAAWQEELKKIAEHKDLMAEPSSLELMQDGPAGVIRVHSAELPELGKVPGVEGRFLKEEDAEDGGSDEAAAYQELKRLTGMSLSELMSLPAKVLVRRRVTNQTRLGKVHSISIVAMAGNGNGYLGLGVAKSTQPEIAIETARMLAMRNMKPIRRYENRTIFGHSTGKVSGTVVEMFTRPPGYGLRVPSRIFEMCRACGIHDLSVRMPRSTNPMNAVKAAYQALTNQPDPAQIAIGRGKKMVDARKVYYGGDVH
ncbi:hypothetical protein S7711_05117 [Stachybotrys chartarum IBT 7711]|uniref:S5 DRBM domain-containing protein n=1 Tax=Stachybotrys chartarum (strain CBS 109288 / IBT 7711) TaxID=1280523 RepID=A0A084ANW7_STACB|nr:hypothetical protein S7711_05117 [Stachybotrys chartarum IBT 7711]KFA47428.1 hypothetical protein S40293_05393 [Stachybotrys chartarum IBT 40293]